LACLGALGAAAALLLLATGSAGGTDRAGSVLAAGRGLAIEQLAPAAAGPAGNARSFGGMAAVGALFSESNGKLGSHFCTASVVGSAAGDLAVTAAHCVYGTTGTLVFVPAYADGKTPYGVWPVTKVYTDSAWDARQDPDHDVAFLRLSERPTGRPSKTSPAPRPSPPSPRPARPSGSSAIPTGRPSRSGAPAWSRASAPPSSSSTAAATRPAPAAGPSSPGSTRRPAKAPSSA
jgi:hypothetical protein